MSLQFSNTTTKGGIIQHIERYCGFNDGDISGNALKLAQFTSDVNLAHDEVINLAIEAGGTWKFDDSNHTDYPIMRTALVDGQRDYTFTADGSGNLVLDIYKVVIKREDGSKVEIYPVDQEERGNNSEDVSSFYNGEDAEGTPTRYDKSANGILLDLIPNYDMARGLEVHINREGSYFLTSDTTKKPGVDGRIHEYYPISVSEKFASINTLPNRKSLLEKKMLFEYKIQSIYGRRERDVPKRLVINKHDNK